MGKEAFLPGVSLQEQENISPDVSAPSQKHAVSLPPNFVSKNREEFLRQVYQQEKPQRGYPEAKNNKKT